MIFQPEGREESAFFEILSKAQKKQRKNNAAMQKPACFRSDDISAVDAQGLAGDEGGVRPAQEQGGAGDILRLS